jgi:hypothetical protein
MTPHNHYTNDPLVITHDRRVTLPRRLIPTSAIKNTSKYRKNATKPCWLRDGVSQADDGETVRWQNNLSKTHPNVMAAAEYIEY